MVYRLLDVIRLAGQRGLVNLQIIALNQHTIGWKKITFKAVNKILYFKTIFLNVQSNLKKPTIFHLSNITDDQLGDHHLNLLTTPNHRKFVLSFNLCLETLKFK